MSEREPIFFPLQHMGWREAQYDAAAGGQDPPPLPPPFTDSVILLP